MKYYTTLFLLNLMFLCLTLSSARQTSPLDGPTYVYSDFGGGKNTSENTTSDEQIAQELSNSVSKKRDKQELLINDSKSSCVHQTSLLDRPMYVYSDFGGGKNTPKQAISDEQTAQELSSAAWKKVGKRELLINDSAHPLSPSYAALALAKAFPYQDKKTQKKGVLFIKEIVVHVIDPGVENDNNQGDHHPRAAVLRKDGVLFVGPDNNTLSLVCPKGSIAGIWQINTEELRDFSGNDTVAGGTFHGRDVFLEYALLVAAEKIKLGDFSKAYAKPDLKYRLSEKQLKDLEKDIQIDAPEFSKLSTYRWTANWQSNSATDEFSKAFFLGIIQSPWYKQEEVASLPFKIFWAQNQENEELIAIINTLSRNIYVGPNNGWGTSFFLGYSKEDINLHKVDKEVLSNFWQENNHKKLINYVLTAPSWQGKLEKVSFLGGKSDVLYNERERPTAIKARIWIDAYGNIKTSLRSDVFSSINLGSNPSIHVEINGVTKSLLLESSFTRVPKGGVILYAGSSAIIGDNPKRSLRYMEISTNGVYGKFGSDLFSHKDNPLIDGQIATFSLSSEGPFNIEVQQIDKN